MSMAGAATLQGKMTFLGVLSLDTLKETVFGLTDLGLVGMVVLVGLGEAKLKVWDLVVPGLGEAKLKLFAALRTGLVMAGICRGNEMTETYS